MSSIAGMSGFWEKANPLRHLPVWMKLVLSAVITFVVIGYILMLTIGEHQKKIDFSAKEIIGTEYIPPAYQLLKFTQIHRGSTNAFLNGNEQAKQVALNARQQLESLYPLYVQKLTGANDPLNILDDVDSLVSNWNRIKANAFDGPAPEVFKDHTAQVARIQNLILTVADESNLTLDPELDSFYLMEIISFRLHRIAESMGRIRGLGAGVIEADNFTTENSINLAKLVGSVDVEGLESSFQSAFDANPGLREVLYPLSTKTIEEIYGFDNLTIEIIEEGRSSVTSSEFFRQGTEAINDVFKLVELVTPELVTLLDERVQYEEDFLFWLVLEAMIGIVIALIVVLFSIQGIIGPVNKVGKVLKSISSGNLDNKIEVFSKDEMGKMLHLLGDMQVAMKAEINSQIEIAEKSTRIRRALDVCDTSVMVADNNFDIIYLNASVEQMMNSYQGEFQKEIPSFNSNNLMGSNIDRFHKDPNHQRQILRELKQPHSAELKIGELTFRLVLNPIFDEEGQRLGTVLEWIDLTEILTKQAQEKEISDANARVKQALDNVTTNAMVADSDFNIVYMNKAISKMMSEAESDLKADLPNFDAQNLLNQNIDIFHKKPSHQREVLSRLTDTYSAQIEVGGRTFSLTANPVVNDGGERIGTVVEWTDKTKEIAAQREVDALVESAARGDLTARISETEKEEFFLNLARGLNRLIGIADGVINDTARVLDAMAHGDLTETIEKDYDGSFGKLKRDANATVEKLTEIISEIREAAGTVTTGASEIAQGNADLSQRTEEQASSLEETASSMEEMTSTVKQSADNASQANVLASEAKDKAQLGGKVVERAVAAMGEINDASNKISDIIGVIDEIAFQTNLLALNAAVEAARAGEQGRGFAVVAGEVRSLAQRSAGAAKEIKDLIRDSVEKVSAGTELVNESGQTLNDIVTSVEKVSNMISDISIASQEQTNGIEQVNKAVNQMDEMTQQNAALVEEASAAGEAMADQAKNMMQLMGFFSVDNTSASQPIPALKQVNKISENRMDTPVSPPVNSPVTGKNVVDPNDEWEEF